MAENRDKKLGRQQSNGWWTHLRKYGKKVSNKLTRRGARKECHDA